MKMIRYLNDHDPAGKVLEWEAMVKSGVSAPVLSGIAKSMMTAINADMAEIARKRTEGKDTDVEKSVDTVRKCDVAGIIVSTEGNYMAVRYTLLLNMISLKDLHTIREMGFIDRKIRH